MRKLILFAALTALPLMLCGYDLKNRALTPVEFRGTPKHAALELVKGGKLQFSILYDRSERNDLGSTKRGAELLQEAFEKCTASKPEIFDFKEAEKAAQYPFVIMLGDNPHTRKFGVNPEKIPEQGYELKTFAGGIVIAGHDSSTYRRIKGSSALDNTGPMRGTLWGACDFTERMMGCRYFFPGEYGSLWPKITDLTIEPAHYSDYPRFVNRDGCWIGWSMRNSKAEWEELLGSYQPETNYPDKGSSIMERWRVENFMGPHRFHPGHDPDPHRIVKFFPDRKKDIFFTNAAGYMYYNEKQHIGNDFDLTNLKFADIIIEAMKKYYGANGKDFNIWAYPPNQQFINFGQCDGEVQLADMMQNPIVKELNLITQANLDRGSPFSEIYGRFLQYYAQRIKEEFPGLKVAFMPYQSGTYAPLEKRWKLPDNVVLRVCTHVFPRVPRNPEKIKATLQCLKEWYEATGNRPIDSLWFYHIPAAEKGGSPFLRAIAAQFVGESIKVCGDYLGRTNIFFDQYGGLDWSFYYSEYCGVRSMWNPDFNVDAAVAEHWEPFYGAESGNALREFHDLLKDSYVKYYMMAKENTINPLYPPKVIDTLEAALKKAAAAIPPGGMEEKRFRLFAAPWAKAIEGQRSRQNYVRPVYGVYRLLPKEDSVTLDGLPGETFWSKIKSIPLQDPNGSGEAPKFPVQVKLAWDEHGIYGLTQAEDAPLADAKKTVWGNDSYEFLFSPGTKREEFYLFAIDAVGQGATGHRRLLPISTPFNGQWKSPGFKYAVQNNAVGGWSMEFFIPFADIQVAAPKPYEIWNANIVRNKLGTPPEYFSSSLTLSNNHNLEMFGNIKFLGKGD